MFLRRLSHVCRLMLLALPLLASDVHAQADQGPIQRYGVSVPYAGSYGTATFSWRNFPQTRLYADFTEAEKKVFHAWYEQVVPGDEPPYPTINMASISQRFSEYMQRYPISGRVEMLIQVGEDGVVKSFSVLKTSSPEVAEFNMLILRDVRFKPAKCSGKPCAMDFPWFYTMVRSTI